MEREMKVEVEPKAHADLHRLNTLATLTAPVGNRSHRSESPRKLRRYLSSPLMAHSAYRDRDLATTSTRRGQEAKLTLPNNPEAWARYGFLDENLLLPSSPALENSKSADCQRQSIGRDGVLAENRVSASTGNYSVSAAVLGPSQDPASNPAAATGRRPQPVSGPQSPEFGTSTPPTVILTPTSQERSFQVDGTGATIIGSSGASATVNRHARALSSGLALSDSRPSAHRDSLALAAASASALAASIAEENRRERERREEEERVLRQQEERALLLEELEAANGAARATAMALMSSNTSGMYNNGGTSSSIGRRPPRTMAEIERYKRNHAERLRAYGCQRTLYPRIVPAPNSGSGSPRGTSSSPFTEETETEQWVNTLRVSASLRGESLMTAHTQSFAQERAASLLVEKQSDARASRIADVSEMEGPDGLLHCAVLKGEHALAARAAQFLVDKRGANVNSRDPWGRTPLHSASGQGMVAMARFFVRRGANVDALDQDNRTPLFFACAGGHTTMARYLTRIEVGARLDLRDSLGHLVGEYFWDTVEQTARDEILAILFAAGWPDPPPIPVYGWSSRSRGRGGRSQSVPGSATPPFFGNRGGDGKIVRYSDGGEGGMKRFASDMMLMMKRG